MKQRRGFNRMRLRPLPRRLKRPFGRRLRTLVTNERLFLEAMRTSRLRMERDLSESLFNPTNPPALN